MTQNKLSIWFLSSFLIFTVTPSSAQDQTDFELRLQQLEQRFSAEPLLEMLQTVKLLQQETQELRGDLQMQIHNLTQLKEMQMELNVDFKKQIKANVEAILKLQATTTDVNVPKDETESIADPTLESIADPTLEKDSYQNAYDLIKSRRYEEAITAFTAFLEKYPKGKYSSQATYWLGEAYKHTKKFDAALSKYRTLIWLEKEIDPDHPKTSLALLKIGIIQNEIGQRELAVKTLNDVIMTYPGSNAALIAKEWLTRIIDD